MLWTPQKGRVRTITNDGIVGTVAMGTAVTSNGTTLLDGAVTEIISAAANDQDSWGINIWISDTGASATASEACMDVLIGGATDDVLIAALICGYTRVSYMGFHQYYFPIHIPQGKRIAMTHANVRVSATARVVVTLYGGGVPPHRVGRKVTTYGTQVNNARGQAVTPGVSGGAATASEMTSSTSEDHFAFLPGFQPTNDTTIQDGWTSVGIGVGAATEDRIGTWLYGRGLNESVVGPMPHLPAMQDVPAGSRLTLLASHSGVNDAGNTALIYAVS